MTDYPYPDVDGNPFHKVVKRELQNGKKTYHQEHWEDGRWVKGGVPSDETVIYDLPNVDETIDEGERAIWIVEGEKDASNGRMAYGICTTTNPGGAGKWKDHHSRLLKGAEEVYIVWDRDDKGAEHAWSVYESLRRVGIPDIHFRCARYGNDLSDHINEGGRLDNLVKKRPPKPEPKPAKEKQVQSDGELLPAPFQLALIKLQELGPVAIEDPEAHQYNALCPAHDDSDPSLTIRPGMDDDSVAVLVHCFAGCTSEAIATALGIPPDNFTVITDQESLQDRENRRALMRMEANSWARTEYLKKISTSDVAQHKGYQITGTEELAIPIEPTKWLVEKWFAYGETIMLVADPKAGKTRLCMNLMQSLTDGTPFLGKYKVEMPEGGKVWYGNYDMPANQFRQYLDYYSWQNPDRWVVRHLGAGQFPFWRKEVFDDFVEYALSTNIHFAIFDTFQIASQGNVLDENNNTEVTEFISKIKDLCAAAGIPNSMIVHHRGRTKETHGRGASSLEANVSGWWTLTKDKRELQAGPRFLQAVSRGGGHAKVQLGYDEGTGLYTTDGREVSEEGSTVGGPKVDKAVVKCAAYCRRLKSYSDENGSWPRGKVARGLIVGSAQARTEIMEEALSLGLTVHTAKAGRSFEVSLTDDGLTAMNSAAAFYVDKQGAA